MKNELLEIKKIFQVILTQCKSGITIEDLNHEVSYSNQDTLDYLLYLTKAELITAINHRYYPTAKAIDRISPSWHLY